ncbi:MAG: hypothetical protein FWD64_13765, partial [Acidobacteriaceae bacterium]|nr:hypothetical protein [Acidobacteriaceae bacterium]
MKTHLRLILLLALACVTLPSFTQTATPPAGNVYVIPFSHLDLYWGCTREECLSRGNRIIGRAMQLLQAHPEFRFMMEDDVFVAN